MAYLIDVTLSVAGHDVLTAEQAELGTPDDRNRYTLTGVQWLVPGRMPWLDFLQRACEFTGVGPLDRTVTDTATITGTSAFGDRVFLD